MTLFSLAVAMMIALVIGLLMGRLLAKFRAGDAVAVAVAAAVGLVVLHASDGMDVLRVVRPRSAMDWLPAFCLVAAAIVRLSNRRYRIPLATGLAILIPIRLLWGSAYFRADQLDGATMISIAVWMAAFAVVMFVPYRQQPGRFTWDVAAWAIAVVLVAMTVTMSGSLTYGASVGVVGISILAVLISTANVPTVAAVPLVALVGISAAYSELPLGVATALLIGICGLCLLRIESVSKWTTMLRVGSMATLLLGSSLTVAQFADEISSTQTESGGYGNLTPNATTGEANTGEANTVEANSGGPLAMPPVPEDSPIESSSSPEVVDPLDPFGGIGLDSNLP